MITKISFSGPLLLKHTQYMAGRALFLIRQLRRTDVEVGGEDSDEAVKGEMNDR